jgi:hyperosmotically inducible periplasmic protein
MEVVMISRKKLLLSACVALVLTATSARAADSSMGVKLDDAAVTAKVKAALIDNPATKARQINVDTSHGVVQLNGMVDSAAEKQAAADSAKMVMGVASVDNNLEVRSGERTAGAVVDDTTITAKVKAALIADKRIKARQVEVKTYKGVVTLGGFVATATEKQAAEDVAEDVAGVVKVDNGIVVNKG